MDNFSQIDRALDAWIDDHTEEIIRETQGLLRIPSVEGPAVPSAPFGLETRRALDFALGVAERYGLTTKQLDGYAGHAEWIGPNTEINAPIVGILAHLDVVPVGDESQWKSPPFGAEIRDGMLIARGAIDDKGPAMAGLYALLAVSHCNVPATRRIRVILGLDEESGDGCVKHYFAHEEMPKTGFTPDAEFPLIYAEKGIADVLVAKNVSHDGERLHILEISGGERSNMVPDKAIAILGQTSGSWLAVNARLNAAIGIRTEIFDDAQKLKVIAEGISAHGSTPNEGVNAIAVLCDALLMLDYPEDQHDLITQIQSWAADTTGGRLGIAGSDNVAGSLTSNLGMVSYASGQARLIFNIRYPVTWNQDTLYDLLKPIAEKAGFSVTEVSNTPPLYVPQDDPLVDTLLSVYRMETGDLQAPMTIGGGTYARVMKHGVAFGAFFPGAAGGGAHQANESWAIADLIQATKIYAKAITRLACQ